MVPRASIPARDSSHPPSPGSGLLFLPMEFQTDAWRDYACQPPLLVIAEQMEDRELLLQPFSQSAKEWAH